MYNQAIKQRYLDSTRSPEPSYNLFMRSQQLEERFNKDIYDFTIFELRDLFNHYNPRENQDAERIFKLLDQYTAWSISEGLKEFSISTFSAFLPEWSHQFVRK